MTPWPSWTMYAGSTEAQLVRMLSYLGSLIFSIQPSSWSCGIWSSSLSMTSRPTSLGSLFACSACWRAPFVSSHTRVTGTPYVSWVYFLNWSMKTFLGRPLKPQLFIVTVPSDFSAAAISSFDIPVPDAADALAVAGALADAAALADAGALAAADALAATLAAADCDG